jgi:hypothetical protein
MIYILSLCFLSVPIYTQQESRSSSVSRNSRLVDAVAGCPSVRSLIIDINCLRQIFVEREKIVIVCGKAVCHRDSIQVHHVTVSFILKQLPFEPEDAPTNIFPWLQFMVFEGASTYSR